MLLKTALSEPLYGALDIQPLKDGDEGEEIVGFLWEMCRQKPIMEKINGKDSVLLATVPCIVHRLTTDGLSTDHGISSLPYSFC
jgi:hypothetical protein